MGWERERRAERGTDDKFRQPKTLWLAINIVHVGVYVCVFLLCVLLSFQINVQLGRWLKLKFSSTDGLTDIGFNNNSAAASDGDDEDDNGDDVLV